MKKHPYDYTNEENEEIKRRKQQLFDELKLLGYRVEINKFNEDLEVMWDYYGFLRITNYTLLRKETQDIIAVIEHESNKKYQ